MPSRLKGIETNKSPVEFDNCERFPLYMPSRLKGIETFRSAVCSSRDPITLYMPSRLKGIETYREFGAETGRYTLYMPSRLKGMETKALYSAVLLLLSFFVYAFPFEGNGNSRHLRS